MYDSNKQNISDESNDVKWSVGRQDKTKRRLSVSTMINASGFATFFVQRNCPQGLSVLLVIIFIAHL